ncbi:hypothetical protein M011DRAFT_405530 [Sporormia fimetaria CBS 119925]|uniref:Intramembrane protease 2 n=1 Tax=Sporormia fimetaria CBS 119925 TaxID=1340428 RepID=A0A6A6V858_9PLEO|nr:hypothetical protein M011DRAFT_405530 [Sporormia fimetaria CBS 119925]
MADLEPGLLARIAGRMAYEFTLMQPMVPTYIHLLISALLPIYAGAHASLSRPSSAAKPKKSSTRHKDQDYRDDEDEDEETSKMEGMSPTDAIVFPLMAGLTLTGLYFLIRWLDDPTLLNKCLNAYFAVFGVFSVARLVTDALNFGHSIIFPRRYALNGALYHVNGMEKQATPVSGKHGNGKDEPKPISSPLPGFLARIPLPDSLRELLWSDRAMPRNKWTVRMYLHRVVAGKALIGPHGIFGSLFSLSAVAYFNFVDKPWYLTNLMGFGFSYGALQLMSPTTFATGSLILMGLFFYDIYMVFFTPMMVTVAKTLDVPIKLVFPRPSPVDSKASSLAMLGLGDVVLPGIMIGLALRFDLYLFYLRRQKRKPATDGSDTAVIEKPTYFSLSGRWSDHFWTHSLFGRPLFPVHGEGLERPFTFPKTYFRAALVGYVAGMLATLGVMQVWHHAQPALLYLVPGVLIALWGTALVRGELGLMWRFTEAVEEEDEAAATGKDETATREARMKKALGKHIRTDSGSEDESKANSSDKDLSDRVAKVAEHRPNREVFSFSIEAPWQLKHPRSVHRHHDSTSAASTREDAQDGSQSAEESPTWAASKGEKKAEEPAGKRVRLN